MLYYIVFKYIIQIRNRKDVAVHTITAYSTLNEHNKQFVNVSNLIEKVECHEQNLS